MSLLGYGYGAITLCGIAFQRLSPFLTRLEHSSTHHISLALSTRDSVWLIPLSLAAINGIAVVFFSSAY